MRVAVTQFSTSTNVQNNLATCIRMINEAAVCKPSLIVLPEYCNTLFHHAFPCYQDHNQAWNEALSLEGDFLKSVAEQARKHCCYIVINVTLRRGNSFECKDSNISVTSCLFSPQGELISQSDKQVLIGYENDFFTRLIINNDVIATPFGKLGLLTGNDNTTFKASRELTLKGAQLLCNPINTYALDQASLHNPARACENNVFLLVANKVGSLVPQTNNLQEPDNIPQEYLVGVGQSQIITPNGNVLAKIENNKEGFIFADISIEESGLNKKIRPDGTEFIKQHRPELYQASPKTEKVKLDKHAVPATANVAIFATYKSNEQAIEDVCHYIDNNLSDIIQLPELFFIADKKITKNKEERTLIEEVGKQLIHQVSAVLRPFQYVCTSLIIEGIHQAVIINEHGVFAIQQQLHFCTRYQWTTLGNSLNIIALPLEQGFINIAMLTADDANIAEIVNMAALNNIHVLLVPFDIQEAYEVEYSLLASAAENRICIVAASREKSFTNNLSTSNNLGNESSNNPFGKNKIKHQKSTGFIANLPSEHALLTHWKSRKFIGHINQPMVKHQHGKITKALVHPVATTFKNYNS